MSVYMFAGQGTQKKGMGAGLFLKYPEYVEQANEILGYEIDKLCLEDSERNLNHTKYAQPCIYFVSALAYLEMRAEIEQNNPVFIGNSLGEYNALHAAGALDLFEGLRIVKERGELMGSMQEGKMLAVTGMNETELQTFLSQEGAELEISNYNTVKQHVVAGKADEVKRISRLLRVRGTAEMVIPLRTSGAFHSKAMTPCAAPYKIKMETVDLRPLKYPVYANYNAQPYEDENLRCNLLKQLDHPVKWRQIIEALLKQSETEFIEIGGGSSLVNMVENIRGGN